MSLTAPPVLDVSSDPSLPPRRQGLIVLTLCMSVVVIIAGVASLNVAIPTPGLDEVVREAPGVGLAVAAESGPAAPDIVGVVEQAVTDGFGLAMWVAAGAAVVGAVYVAIRTPPVGAEASALDASPST